MKDILFFHKDSALVSNASLVKYSKQLKKEILQMNKAALNRYEDDRASIHAPFDKYAISSVENVIHEKLKLKPDYIVVVGIGGSNLGTIAVQEAVLGKLHNQTGSPKVLYADTVDAEMMHNVMSIVERALKDGKNVIINGVSKSGGTTETIANFEILVNLLKKKRRNYKDYVVVTTDQGSKFWKLATDKGFSTLEIPKKIGGRYSVFSPVGLFPLGMLGVDIKKLLKGARTMRGRCLKTKWQDNPAAISAMLRFIHHNKGKNINDMFLFRTDLESIGKWYRQLMGESIGKEFNLLKKKVNNGITPTVSVGSTDLHSMAQLYLGGPYDKYTLFVSAGRGNNSVNIPPMREYGALVPHIQGKSLDNVMGAILQGVKKAFVKGKRPFSEVILPEVSEEIIGQLLQMLMMEMMYLGRLMNVNPFDQPNVEAYKIETKKILARAK